MTVVSDNVKRSNTQNRMTDYGSGSAQGQMTGGGVMMNNFAGPSDTQNFAHNEDMY